MMLGLLLFFLLSGEKENCVVKERPNVIFILVDDVGVADTSFSAKLFNSNPRFRPAIDTPNIDRFAREGTIFWNFRTAYICGPTRAAILTSRYPFKTGNPFPTSNGGSFGGDLDPRYKTMGHEFQERGYATHFIGKWGVDNGREPDRDGDERLIACEKGCGYGPQERGFDTFLGPFQSALQRFSKKILFEMDWHQQNASGRFDAPETLDPRIDEHADDIYTKEAVKIIKNQAVLGEPFFLHLSYNAAHDPLTLPERWVEHPHPRCVHIRQTRRYGFCHLMQMIDEGLEMIRYAMKDAGILENTILLFSSDNGGMPVHGGFNYPLKANKASQNFEGSTRVPAFIWAPGVIPEDVVYKDIFGMIDVAPTLLGFVDKSQELISKTVIMGDDIDGIDLSDSLRQLNASPTRQEMVLHHQNWDDTAAFIANVDGTLWKIELGVNALTRDIQIVLPEPPGSSFFTMSGSKHFFNRIVFHIVEVLAILIDIVAPDKAVAANGILLLGATVIDKFYGCRICSFNPRYPTKSLTDVRPYTPISLVPGMVGLYNLDNDISETTNLVNERGDIMRTLYGRFYKITDGDYPPHVAAIMQTIKAKGKIAIRLFVILGIITCLVGVFALVACWQCLRWFFSTPVEKSHMLLEEQPLGKKKQLLTTASEIDE